MKTLLRSLSVVAALAVAGLALTACGPDDSQNQGQQGGNTTSSKQVVNQPAADPSFGDQRDSLLVGAQGEISLNRNFYIVFDGSGSMSGDIEEAKEAVVTFANTVNGPDVNFGLYVFDSNGRREVVPLAPNNLNEFLNGVASVRADGGTPLGASIEQGVTTLTEQYKKQLGYGDFRLIVVTDGDSSDSFSRGVQMASSYGMPIYTIGFNMRSTHDLAKHSVSYTTAQNKAELAKALESAVSELDVYQPTDFQN